MLHLKLTPRSIRRLCVTMALIAPIIYLFGSLFTGLNGAHGGQVFAQTDDNSYSISSPWYLNQWISSSGVITNQNGAGTSGYIERPSEEGFSVTLSFSVAAIGLYDSDYSFISRVGVSGTSISIPSCSYFRLSVFESSPIVDNIVVTFSYPVGIGPLSSINFSDYVFGQFFARDNFVSKIGEDAISETPHGFAPFGALFRWLDLNVFNIGGTQVGLMAYGYLYWCAHVLVFDLVFMCATFFISFVDSCFTKFNRSE